MGIEDPDADVAEQHQPVDDDEGTDTVEDPGSLPLEANAADVAEQREIVPEYDDDAR